MVATASAPAPAAWRWFADAPWLTGDRARAYGRLLALAVLLLACWSFGAILRPVLTDTPARPIGSDFNAFWSSARLALHGPPSQVYDFPAIRLAEQAGVRPDSAQFLPYVYPPPFLMLCLPLGLLPYLAALAGFTLAGSAAAAACIRRLLPAGWTVTTVIAFPPLVLNAIMGQNGALSAACYGGAMLLLDASPALAGACLGLLVCKPHLAVGVPVALIAARRWTALLACAATAAGLVLASWLVLGGACWRAFAASLPMTAAMLHDADTWPKMVSVFAGTRMATGSWALADAAQAATVAVALGCVALVCARRPGAAPETAVVVTAAVLCPPHILDYDLVCLGLPMAWLAGEGCRRGWRPLEKSLLAACYVMPLAARMAALQAGLPLMAPLLCALLAAVVVSARADAAMPAARPRGALAA